MKVVNSITKKPQPRQKLLKKMKLVVLLTLKKKKKNLKKIYFLILPELILNQYHGLLIDS